MFIRKSKWKNMLERLSVLEERAEELEDNFEYPRYTLDDTEFKTWILKMIWANTDSTKRELYMFMNHLGYVLTTYSQRTVVEKIKPIKKGEK